MRARKLSLLLLLTSAVSLSLAADERHDHGPNIGNVGSMNFPVSCSPPAQKMFSRSVAMLHSFWYEEAARSFSSVAEADPTCAMAWWGVAMSYYHPLWEPPTAEAMQKGGSAIGKAKSLVATTDRERAYIAALDGFYTTDASLDYLSRNRVYSQAMERVYRGNPQDSEAAIFYALSLVASASPKDKTYANQRQAGAILEKIFAKQPDHPGVAHYIIHSYDNPVLASQGLEAARRYAKIAPAVPHALHMPSHIFVRLGLWDDAAKSNLAAMQAGQNYEQEVHMDAAWDQRLHPTDYLAYSLLQSGRDVEAEAVVKKITQIKKIQPDNLTGGYVLAVVPARYAAERRSWAEAAALVPRPSAFHYTEAVTYWAKAMGYARTGNSAAARQNLDKVQSIRDQLKESKQDYWSDQTEVLAREASAWLAHAQAKPGDNEEQTVALMRSAADLENSMEKHPITPGAVLPAIELLGDLLLELDRPAEALAAYENSLHNAPERFNSLAGAARAADLSGDGTRARQYYGRLLKNCDHSETARGEITAAKVYLAKK